MENLQGKLALVTGSSRGIGRAIAVALARAGADVALNYRTRTADAKDTEAEIGGMGRRCTAIQADVSLASGVDRLVDTVRTELGHIDILVNNAGIARVQSIEEITEQDWDELLTVNLKSCFLVTQAVLPGMRARRWGRIINLSSVAAHVGGVVGAHYAASKAGMLGLTHFYASRLAQGGGHGECNFTGADRDGDGHVKSERDARPDSHRAFRRGQRSGGCRRDAGAQRLHYGTDAARQRGLVYELSLTSAPLECDHPA